MPRRSLPAMTSVLSMPGRGDATTTEMKDSHFPLMAETSIFPHEMSESMTSDLPIVPAMMETFPVSTE